MTLGMERTLQSDRAFRRNHGKALTSALILAVGVTGLTACGTTSKSSAGACPSADRTQLFTGTIRRLQPSEPFTVAADTTVWLETTTGADKAGLDSHFGIATVGAFPAGGSPDVRTDPNGFQSIGDPAGSLRKPNVAVALPVQPGQLRLYTVTLGISELQLAVFSCSTTRK
jgi:hypothetical protein